MQGIGNNLKKARLLKNLSLQKAGKLLNMSTTAISKYEKGIFNPDSKKIIAFANAYGVRAETLIKVYDHPKMEFLTFRKKKRLTGQRLELLKSLIEENVTKYLEVVDLSNLETNVNIKKYGCKNLNDAEKSANEFRDFIKISKKQPITDLTNILENLGILIIPIKDENKQFQDFDGLSEYVKGIPIIALLDDIKDGARQRFTIAHELGHLLLDIKDTNLDEEKLCNRFASSLLMPQEAVINEFGSTRKNINFFELTAFKQEYKVSYSAIIYRLRDLEIISEYLYKRLSILISQYIGKKDPNPIEPEKSYQFKRLVYKLEAREIITLNKACELLGVTINEYNNENNSY